MKSHGVFRKRLASLHAPRSPTTTGRRPEIFHACRKDTSDSGQQIFGVFFNPAGRPPQPLAVVVPTRYNIRSRTKRSLEVIKQNTSVDFWGRNLPQPRYESLPGQKQLFSERACDLNSDALVGTTPGRELFDTGKDLPGAAERDQAILWDLA
jgi:hypothetical protein